MVNKHARSVLRIALKPEPTQRGTSRGNGASRSGPNKARAAFSPCGAARINVAALLLITVPTPDGRGALAHGRANVLTLSCKTRLTCLPRKAARRLPRLTRSGRSELQLACRARADRKSVV